MKCMILSLLALGLLQAQQPFLTRVGPLSCGARMYTATQFQTWCYSQQANLSWKLVHNQISEVADGNAVIVGFAQTTNQMIWTVNKLGPEVKWQAISTDLANSTSPPNYTEGIWSALVDIPKPEMPRIANWVCCVVPRMANLYNVPLEFNFVWISEK